MHAISTIAGLKALRGVRVPRARCLLTVVILAAGAPAIAASDRERETGVTSIESAPSPARTPAAPQDEFLPISKVVPRAKIALGENERLPDLGGEETYASHGSRSYSYVWYEGESFAPLSSFAFHPLYFEDPNLERCGLTYGCCLQPLISGMHFFGTVAILPYKVLVSPPCRYVCPLGDCPAGCRFGYCENFIGPRPDFGMLLRSGCLSKFRCHR